MTELEKKFKSVVPYANFMTPDVKSYIRSGNYICELSYGYGFCLHTYGVTVVDESSMKKCDGLSMCFSNSDTRIAEAHAMEYINSLSNGKSCED